MNLDLDGREQAFQLEARTWLEANVPTTRLPSMDTPRGFAAHRDWEAKLAEDRWSVVAWPAEYRGRGASLTEWVIFEEEYYRAGAPGRVAQNGIALLAPALFEHGTTEQRDRFLPAMATGEQIWAQAWSEPDAGSDLAALRSTATRDAARRGWVLNGQKTWSSRAAFAGWGFGLFRSDPDARRHRGLTYFLFPLDAPGVTVRPIPQLDGEQGFAEIFFDDVYVPDRDVLGAPGDGWQVAMSTTANERGLTLRAPGRFTAATARLVELWRQEALVGPTGTAASTADRVVDAWVAAQAYRAYTWATVTHLGTGGHIGAAGSVNKVFWSELDIAIHETALDLLGPNGELRGPGSTDDGRWSDGYLFSLAGPIYAGTNEIQRNIIAERLLGLPRGA